MRCSEYYRPFLNRALRIALLFSAFGVASTPVAANPSLSNTEQWILSKVAAGEDADLTYWSTDKDARVISGSFLRLLLTKNLPGARVPAYGVRIWNATVRGDLNLNNEEIPYFVTLNRCTFENNVVLVVAHFLSSLHLEGSTFNNLADFRYVVINGDLEAVATHFINKDSTANFGGMKVEGPVFLDAAIFDGPTSFYGATIKGNLQARDIHFNDTVEGANFELVNVSGSAMFNGSSSVFAGPVRFYKASIGGTLEAEDAHFTDAQRGAQFEGVKVNGYIFLRRTVFRGPVTFYRASITDNLVATDTKFQSETAFINFESMVVKGHAFYDGAIFSGPVSFLDTTVEGKFHLNGTQFNASEGGVAFNQVKAGGIGLSGTIFKGPVTLNDMSYQRVSWGTPEDVLSAISHAKFDSGAYETLAQYHRKQGNTPQADAVYIMQRKRERSTLSLVDPRWWWNISIGFLIGYGRNPELVILWGAIVVAFGVYVFRKRFMEPQKLEYDSRPYSAFLYSLDLFLPIVDLHAANVWMPKSRYGLVRWYLPVHVIAGWILVTIFIAALSGILK